MSYIPTGWVWSLNITKNLRLVIGILRNTKDKRRTLESQAHTPTDYVAAVILVVSVIGYILLKIYK